MPAIKALGPEQTTLIYLERIREDFPAAELKGLKQILRLMERGIYHGLGFFMDSGPEDAAENPAGYLYYNVDPSDAGACLVDYLAVRKDLRGQGVGKEMLRLLRETCPEMKTWIVEVENPFREDNPEQRRMMAGRMGFYLQSGFTDTGIDARVFGVEFRLLSLSSPAVSPDAVRRCYERIYANTIDPSVLKDELLIRTGAGPEA